MSTQTTPKTGDHLVAKRDGTAIAILSGPVQLVVDPTPGSHTIYGMVHEASPSHWQAWDANLNRIHQGSTWSRAQFAAQAVLDAVTT